MVRHGKPAPDLFLHVAEAMRVQAGRSLVIEDSPAGVTAGKAAGMTVWGFTGGQHHALLCLADPNFVVPQAIILQRNPVQLDRGSQLLTHFAHCAAQASGAAVRHRIQQASLSRNEQHVGERLLGDGVADLHRVAELIGVAAGKLRTAESRTMNPVATRAPAQHNDAVPMASRLLNILPRDQANTSSKHQRVGHVAVVKVNASGHRRNTHPVAIIAHTRHHLTQDPLRMDHARW